MLVWWWFENSRAYLYYFFIVNDCQFIPRLIACRGGWVKDRKSVLNTRFMLDFNVQGLEGLNLKGIFSYDKRFNSIKHLTEYQPNIINTINWNAKFPAGRLD